MILLLYKTYKRPYLTILTLFLTISLGPLINHYTTSSVSYAYQVIIFTFTLYNVVNNRVINKRILAIQFVVILYIFLQILFIKINLEQIFLSVYRLLIIPSVSFYAFELLKTNNKKISDISLYYLIPNLIVLYYRAFIDYSFFGIMDDYSNTIYSSLYSFGGINYRPSNLHSPIIFSVELVLLLSLYLFEKGNDKVFKILVILSIVPIFLMRSRTSIALLLLLLVYYFVKESNIKSMIIISLTSIILFIINTTHNVFRVFTNTNLNIEARFNSINYFSNNFGNENLIYQIFGKGIGTTNVVLSTTGEMALYVENFHLSILYDLGIFVFFIWIIFNLGMVVYSYANHKSRVYSIMLLGILLINFLASNMTSYTIQMIYIYIILKCTEKQLQNSWKISKINVILKDSTNIMKFERFDNDKK